MQRDFFLDGKFDINTKGLDFTVQQAWPLFLNGGAIVRKASIVNRKGFPGTPVNAAAKAAARSFGRTRATEFTPRGTGVNSVSPGPIATPIYTELGMPAAAAKEFEKSRASR